jgi:peptidoglycan/xylan/chitin deacetylase (PgdA/CDA1 family)
MLILRRKVMVGLFLAVLLWTLCALDLFAMFDLGLAASAFAPITRGGANTNSVSLMFNVDWGQEYIPSILEILESKDAKVTFFVTGTWAEDNSELCTTMFEKGHEIGNHGGSHVHVEGMSREELQEVIRQGEESIMKAIGQKCSNLFAPPYGEWDDNTVSYANEIGYSTILWTADTVDWRRPPAETIWKRALAGASPGALILVHPTEPTLEALPTIIDGIREKGLSLCTVSENLKS